MSDLLRGSEAEVLSTYGKLNWFCDDTTGKEAKIKDYPHTLILGGRTYHRELFIRGVIESLRYLGWKIIIISDNAGSLTDLDNKENIIATSTNSAVIVKITQWVQDEAYRRISNKYSDNNLSIGDTAPILFIVNDYVELSMAVEAILGASEFNKFVNNINRINKVGREYRIHLMLSDYANSKKYINSSLLANCSQNIVIENEVNTNNEKAQTVKMYANDDSNNSSLYHEEIFSIDALKSSSKIENPFGKPLFVYDK